MKKKSFATTKKIKSMKLRANSNKQTNKKRNQILCMTGVVRRVFSYFPLSFTHRSFYPLPKPGRKSTKFSDD